MATAFFPGVPDSPKDWTQFWGLRVQSIVNMLVGKANCAADLTLTANATTTTMTDARLSAVSVLAFMPTTANAASATSSIYVTAQKKGQATINHVNNASVDKTYRVAILG